MKVKNGKTAQLESQSPSDRENTPQHRLIGDAATEGPTAKLVEELPRLQEEAHHYASLLSTGNDAPFAELTDGQGQPVGMTGGRRGRVTGTFFHAIAAV